ncbi:terminase small subunit [Nocardia rhizosphaerihabitans]|uniref:terminase small subunit n=1 Tax=Nocardia rhizosphaerihabitans TaxID=1691570 RepID=UPI00366FDE90
MKEEGQDDEQKNLGGRPLKFETVAELKSKVNAYFNRCDPHTEMQRVVTGHDKEGNALFKDAEVYTTAVPYTITGLARACGTTRDVILDYESGKYDDKDDTDPQGHRFSYVVKDAKLRVQENVELMSLQGAGAGAIFWLKNNAGWRDRQELDHTTNGKDLPAPILGGASRRGETDEQSSN